MSTLLQTLYIHVPPERLFTYLASLWESGTALGGEEERGGRATQPLMGRGVRLECPGVRWALPKDSEVEVVDYQEPVGWRAVCDTDPKLAWEVRIEAAKGGARLTCVLGHWPSGPFARTREALWGARRRRSALRHLLEHWKKAAEREDALRRLRANAQSPGPESSSGRQRGETLPEPPGPDARSESLNEGGTPCPHTHED